MTRDVLTQQGVGSTDWAGAHAPPGGTHTGQTVLTMVDGATFTVAHSVPECLTKIEGALAVYHPPWTAFDQPGQPLPVVLDVSRVQSVGHVRLF